MIWKCLISLVVSVLSFQAVEAQTVAEFREVITYLADDARQGRETASKGLYEAQQYIAKELRKAGFDARYQEFKTPYGKCRNIVAWVQGASDEYIVVGAHLDHIGMRLRQVMNGADDNASGSAMTLALARRFKAFERGQGIVPLPHSIVFVWFTGEEHGFWGSKYYVDYPILPGAKRGKQMPLFMLNLDMVGRLTGYSQDWKPKELPLSKILDDLFTRYPFAQKITFQDGSEDSDHYPFYKQGVPIVSLWTGFHQDYHRSTDDADKINYEGMVQVFECAYDLLLGVLYTNDRYDFVNELSLYKGPR